MDNVTARDYLYTYPTINRIVSKYPRPKFGFTEDNIYAILEGVIRTQIDRIKALEIEISEIEKKLDDTEPESGNRYR